MKGIGTIRYHIINDNNKLVTLTIKNAFYVPSLKIRLLSPQQVAAQSTKPCLYSGNANTFHLRWNGHTKTVVISRKNHLPILRTAPGIQQIQRISTVVEAARSMKDPPTCYRASKKLPHFDINPLDDVAIDVELKDK